MKYQTYEKILEKPEQFHGHSRPEEERHEDEHKNGVLDLFQDELANAHSSRRDFLKLFGFSVTSGRPGSQL